MAGGAAAFRGERKLCRDAEPVSIFGHGRHAAHNIAVVAVEGQGREDAAGLGMGDRCTEAPRLEGLGIVAAFVTGGIALDDTLIQAAPIGRQRDRSGVVIIENESGVGRIHWHGVRHSG